MTQTSGPPARAARKPAEAVTRDERARLPQRMSRFLREVVAELRKVIWPTRRELITYTVVVLIFVSVIVAIVASLDFGFAKLVLAVFG